MMWDWVGWFFFFFTTLLLQPLVPHIANCHMLQQKRKGRKSGPRPPRPQTSPTSLMLMEMMKSHLLSSEAVGEAGKDCFKVMKAQKMKQEVLSCFLHAWCLLKSLLTGRVWVTPSALWKREIILFFRGF